MVNHEIMWFAVAIGMACERCVLTSVGLDGNNRVQRDGYFKTKTLADDIARRCAASYWDAKKGQRQ